MKYKPKAEFINQIVNSSNTNHYLLGLFRTKTINIVDYTLIQLSDKYNNIVYISLIKVINDKT